MAKLLATQFLLVLLLSFVAILGQVLRSGTPQLLGHYPAHKCCPNKHTRLSFYFSLDLEGSSPREEPQGHYAIGRWTTYFYMFPCSYKKRVVYIHGGFHMTIFPSKTRDQTHGFS